MTAWWQNGNTQPDPDCAEGQLLSVRPSTANPGEFALELQALPRQRAVVIDEVQRVPALLNLVHRYDEISYWAPLQARETEVDFLLRRGREFLAIEVKAQSRFSTNQLAGLKAIGDLPKMVRRILVYRGDRTLETDQGIEVWPVQAFLSAVADGELWP